MNAPKRKRTYPRRTKPVLEVVQAVLAMAALLVQVVFVAVVGTVALLVSAVVISVMTAKATVPQPGSVEDRRQGELQTFGM